MRLHHKTAIYGDLKNATHILAMHEEDNTFFNLNKKDFVKTYEDATFFQLNEFAFESFREVIDKTDPLDRVFFLALEFTERTPPPLETCNHSYLEQDYFYKLITLLQDEVMHDRAMEAFYAQKLLNIPVKHTKTIMHETIEELPNPADIEMLYAFKYLPDKHHTYKTITALTPYRLEIASGLLEVIHPEENNFKMGLKYTDKFKHPHEPGKIIKEPEPAYQKIVPSEELFYRP